MSEPNSKPFERRLVTRKPGLVGAQWWNEGFNLANDPVSRRQALGKLAALGGAVAFAGWVLSSVESGGSDSGGTYVEFVDALQLQRERGWNFGAEGEAMGLAGQYPVPYEPSTLAELASALMPRQETLKPYYQATLFQSVSGTSSTANSLRSVLKPLYSLAMDSAYQQGQALARLFDEEPESARTTAVLVDLQGPKSVAFAAALAQRFEPVFTFDNWPHPLGVVPAHLTLAAVLYLYPLLRRLSQERQVPAPPVFVLDRHRLEPYTDEQRQFDNRYLVRLPTAQQLNVLGLQQVLYVFPEGQSSQELDDLNEGLVEWRAAGLDVRLVAAGDFQPEATEAAGPSATAVAGAAAAGVATLAATEALTSDRLPEQKRKPLYFGGSPDVHRRFWALYPWARRAKTNALPAALPASLSGAHRYVPLPRSTLFTGLPRSEAGGPRVFPGHFGKVGVWMNTSRQMLGPAFGPRSTWDRSSDYSSSS